MRKEMFFAVDLRKGLSNSVKNRQREGLCICIYVFMYIPWLPMSMTWKGLFSVTTFYHPKLSVL